VRDAVGARVWPVHRLDAATSGVVLFALDAEAAAALSRRFSEGTVEKRYYALVRGRPPPAGTIDHPVPKAAGAERVPAVSDFRALFEAGRYTWLELRPRTGRRHQLRRHLKHMSWPIIGDVRYGKGEHNRHFRERHGLHRLALHAARLRFAGLAGETADVQAAVPADLAGPLRALGVPPPALERHREPWPAG
jgi:tRNA pseudouridine65 synthase